LLRAIKQQAVVQPVTTQFL